MWGAHTHTYKPRTKIDDPIPETTITLMLKFTYHPSAAAELPNCDDNAIFTVYTHTHTLLCGYV